MPSGERRDRERESRVASPSSDSTLASGLATPREYFFFVFLTGAPPAKAVPRPTPPPTGFRHAAALHARFGTTS